MGQNGRRELAGLFRQAIPVLGVIALFTAGAVAVSLLLGEKALALTAEGGPVETATVALYAIGFVASVIMLLRGYRVAGVLALLALLMAAREMDAHKAFTTYGLFKTRLYVSPDVPLAEKLIAGAVVLGLLALLVWSVRAAWRDFTNAYSRVGVTLLGLAGFGVFLKEVDGLPRELRRAGMEMDPTLLSLSKAVEEVGELGLPVILVLGLFQAFLCRK